ncbi:MAG: aldo/keto reductase [Alistipes sp.]|jgi:L-glyceraldehyde 3-phosphate reductase|nr:aldo/keto reductase [Alistipes sp.]
MKAPNNPAQELKHSESYHEASKDRYSKMEYRRCGRSGLKLPAISLGLWHNFGSIDAYENYSDIALEAFDAGITHFDLANNYGPVPGSAETNFGRIMRESLHPYRDEMVISTKAGYLMWDGPYGEWGSRKYMMASLDQSLRRLGLEYVDIFYSHRPDPDTPLEETMGALSDAVRQGKALYAGISNYNAEQTSAAVAILRANGTPCLIHQPKYSMFVREPEKELLPTLEKEGVGLIAYSPLAQGMLTDRYLHGIPEDSRAAKPSGFLQKSELTSRRLAQIAALNAIAAARGQTLAEMALAWLLKDPRVTSVLMGASSVGQLRDNLKALKAADFTTGELDAIEAILQ